MHGTSLVNVYQIEKYTLFFFSQENASQLDKILKKAEEKWEGSPEVTPSSIDDAKNQITQLQVS